MIIDAHAHDVPPEFLDEVASGRRPSASVKLANEHRTFRVAFANNDAKRPVPPGMSFHGGAAQPMVLGRLRARERAAIMGGTAAMLFRIGA